MRASTASSTPSRNPPRFRVRGHRPEQLVLVAQYRQVGDRLTTVGQHDRQIDCDPTRVVTPIPSTQKRLAQPADRPITSARSASIWAPARPTTPHPSAVTTSFGREQVRVTLRVLLTWTM